MASFAMTVTANPEAGAPSNEVIDPGIRQSAPAPQGTRIRHPHAASTSGRFDRESLYAEFAPLVKRLLRQYGTDAELRQDLAGEIYCRFCALVEAFDPERGVPLRPYLVRQLTASTYTYVRSQWVRQKREAFLSWSDGSSAIEPSYDPTPSWLAELSQQQILKSLPHAIAQLPDRQRKVVCWRYYDEMPFEEIGRILEIEPSTVRSLLRHGLNNLRNRMHPEERGH
jgi:RNA polymerase sigma factor (sigma-70 family)